MRGLPLLLSALVACAGASDVAVEAADATIDTAAPPWLLEGELRHDFTVALGRPNKNGPFIPIEDGEDIEIDHGAQGLYHLELDFQAALPAEYGGTMAKLWIDGTTHQPCGAPFVGQFRNKKVPAYHMPPESPDFRPSFNLYLIFNQAQPELYAGQECCVTVHFGAYGPGEKLPSAWTTVERKLRCVDALP